ncbi:MAG TPA: D-alanyl-D-alanine carboxypeptidase [Solirubrobacterales bacterium]|jgi:D-alanyl-D-alanine carboxypeptidase/D-alanyl-D-alanine-endopeptidase (penicillin-binding protein 4)|nr:D-alanyl-D-alanine carboxypeptidase [Solirubrobacterales bacterium]
MRRATILLAALFAAVLPLAAASPAAASSLCDTMRSQLLSGGGEASGLLVVEAESGDVVCSRAAQRPRPLASNMKLFTSATALARFGTEYRIPTKLLRDGRIDSSGVLHGSLYLVGGGDPALGVPAFYGRYHGGLGTNLLLLKRQTREAGIRRVTGRLYADDTIFDRLRGVAYSNYGLTGEIGPLSGLDFDSGYTTPGALAFASDPAKVAASTLASALRGAGVRISRTVALGKAPPAAKRVGVVYSPTLNRIVDFTDVNSYNFFAEMLIKLLGASFGGGGTTAAGAAVVEQFAQSLGAGVHAIDGSGLTRDNLASPQQVVTLLRAMQGQPAGEQFIQDLALAGEEGTVADRMHGTAAFGRCRTKTGTIDSVSNLSGYCFNRDGKVMLFSILMGSVTNLELAHLEQDRIAAAVAGY